MKTGQDITLARQLLEQGKLVAIPTETVYGLAANGLNPDAVLKIYQAKKRPSFNPLILHVARMEEAKKLVRQFPDRAERLAKKFWPGPLTLVLPKSNIVPDIVTAGNDTVAIRVPDHPLTLELLKQLDFPLAAPSANPSGYVSPTTAQHVEQQLGDEVSYILDGGACTVGVESTIVKIAPDEAIVLRTGGLPVEEIESVIGKVRIATATDDVEAPGMLLSHYAPRAQVIIGNIEENLQHYAEKKVGVLSFKHPCNSPIPVISLTLSPSGTTEEAARNIFSYLRKMDEYHLDVILAELLPEEGLGRAVNDRLRRAAQR